MFLPKARNTDIVVQQAGNELLIYNLQTHKAFNLNETSKIVFESCDGKTSFDDLKRKYNFTDDLIYLTLDRLKKEHLLADDYVSPFAGLSRREVIKRVGLASMIALPVISSLVAPSAINAASGACVTANNSPCTFDNYKQSNCCSGLRCDNSVPSGVCYTCIPKGSSTGLCNGAGCCSDTTTGPW